MSYFKGTINGVEYTNKGAFYAALKSQKHKNKLCIKIEENSEAQAQSAQESCSQKCQCNNKQNYSDLLMELFSDIFESFYSAQNKPLNASKKEHIQQDNNQKCTALTHDELLKKYFFKETTYQFTGGEEDENNLNEFSKLLHKLQKEIYVEDLSRLSYKQKQDLHLLSISNCEYCKSNIETICANMQEIDKKMANIENIVSAYEAANINTPEELVHLYDAQKRNFNIQDNKVNYYRLLLEHYQNICPYFNPEV